MDRDRAQETAERDQLWASLRGLRPEIDRIARGEWEDSERQREILILVARIVSAEIDYRARTASAD